MSDVLANNELQFKKSLDLVIKLAEKYFDRFDPNALLELLPPTTPVATLLRYMKTVMEFNNTKKRNLKVSWLLCVVYSNCAIC